MGDVSGIALHESRQALEVSKERIHWLQNSVLLTAAIDWMVSLSSCRARMNGVHLNEFMNSGVALEVVNESELRLSRKK